MTGRRSPNRDPVFLVMVVLAAVILAVTGWYGARPWLAVAFHQCPAPDHAVWAPSIGQAICGESLTVTQKTVSAK